METNRYSLKGWPLKDYIDFGISVGSVWGVTLATIFLAIVALVKKIPIPQIAYAIPISFLIFGISWIFDGIAHRSVYKNVIDRGEFVIHNFMTFFSGFPLFICFIVAYWLPWLMLPFIFGFAFNKTMYSVYDEMRYHQIRFQEGRSDMLEMVAHSFQFLSNCAFDFAWIYWIYKLHYAGIKELFSTILHMII